MNDTSLCVSSMPAAVIEAFWTRRHGCFLSCHLQFSPGSALRAAPPLLLDQQFSEGKQYRDKMSADTALYLPWRFITWSSVWEDSKICDKRDVRHSRCGQC